MAQAGKTFRIFVSSTFSDLKAERDALQRQVFPRLRELCLQHGCRFQAIDLRWGVSEEATLDQQTMKICLEELRRCQRVTPRPNFIVLLGDRYGWRPLPHEIPAEEFGEILARLPGAAAERSRHETLLKTWYRRDDNAAAPVYVLMPREGEFRQGKAWEPVERELRDVLAAASRDMDLSPEARRKYLTSATEQEIVQGLSLPDASGHVFCFFRAIENLPEEKSAADFIHLDAGGRLVEADQRCLDRLRDDLASQLPGNLHIYEASWQDRGGVTTDHLGSLPESLDDCLKLTEAEGAPATLCVDVWRRLSRLILAEIARLEKTDPLEQESAAHAAFGRERAGQFVGRSEILGIIRDYLQGDTPHPQAVWGESGAGKSALLAQAGLAARAAHPQAVVAPRFLGATPASSDIRLLLESLCREISRAYGVNGDDLPVEFRQLEEEFPRRLALATPDKPLIVILDALDQLSDAEQARRLYWLPETLPAHVRLLVSTLPGEIRNILEKKVPARQLLELAPMTPKEGSELLDHWLREAGRTLQPHQWQEILDKFAANGLPLYLRLAFEEARQWHSYDDPDKTRLSPDIPGVIRDLFRRLSQPARHGEVLVSRSLGYLAAGKNGLTEDELLEVLAADDQVMADFQARSPKSPEVDRLPVVVWSRLHFDLEPYLTERQADGAALLAFYHRQLRQVVESDFLSGPEKTARHAALARYFDQQPLYRMEGQWDSRNVRKVSELPYQQTWGELWDDLEKKTLCDLLFIEAKCAAGMTHDLIGDYNLALASLPEAQPEIHKKLERQARIKKYVDDMISYARAWNEARDRHAQDSAKYTLPKPEDIPFPEIPSSTRPWSSEQIETEYRRIIHGPKRLYRIQAFAQFVNSESHGLLNLGHIPSFCLQQAFNSARSGPVAKHTETLISAEVKAILILQKSKQRSDYNPYPAILKILDNRSHHHFYTSRIMDMDVTPDGKMAVSGAKDGILSLWELQTGTCLHTINAKYDSIKTLRITPDYRMLITNDGGRYFTIWNLELGNVAQKIEMNCFVWAFSMTPDGRVAISVPSLRVIDLKNQIIASVKIFHDGVRCVSISPDGKKALSGGEDNIIRVWDLDSGACIGELKGHKDMVDIVYITMDGNMAISASWDNTLRYWDLTSGVCLNIFDLEKPDGLRNGVFSISATADGKKVIAACPGGKLIFLDMESGQRLRNFKFDEEIYEVSITADGKRAVSQSRFSLQLWDMERGSDVSYEKSKRSIKRTQSNSLLLRETASDILAQLGVSLDGGGDYFGPSIQYSPCRTSAIIAGTRSLFIKNYILGSIMEFKPDSPSWKAPYQCLSITPDGERVVTASDFRLEIWDLSRLRLIKDFLEEEPIKPFLKTTCITPDGKKVIAAGGNLHLYDLRKGTCLHKMIGHSNWVTGLIITPDGKKAITASLDRTVRIWDLETARCIAGYQSKIRIRDISTLETTNNFNIYGEEFKHSQEVISLSLKNLVTGPGITTPVCIWKLWHGRMDHQVISLCPFCRKEFSVPREILEIIWTGYRDNGITPDKSPCIELPDEAWEEPRLLSECPKCHKPLKFNPFMVDNRDRY